MSSKKLTEKEEKFCLKYFETGNGLRSVLDAGYKLKETSAGSEAYKLLKKPQIQARLSQLRAKQEKRMEISADRVLKELARVAFVDLTKLYGEDGTLLHPHEIDEDTRRALSGVDVYEEYENEGRKREAIGVTKKVKMNDKIRALELIGKHFKMFTEKHEHSGKISLEQLVAGSHEEDEKE